MGEPYPLTEPKFKFKPGDIALLRSGGPAMTVVRQASERVEATWFSADGINQSGVFYERELFKVVPE
jgi:uncharacterized protein YodC (DUF2158 family)